MARKKESLGEFRAGRYVCHSSYGGMGDPSIYKTYGRVVRVDVENSRIICVLPDLDETYEFSFQYPPRQLGGYCHETIEVIRKKDIPRSWPRKR